ncbi:phospho-N-acetylmuramoyl-pentapeptide-transferase, partial [Trifolium medium]|nr:phospho-N-acetylmuramoyl-pentapeptide-transferase [Trifolium medium]
VAGASGVTIAFAAVGLLSDILNLTKNHRRGLPELAEVFLELLERAFRFGWTSPVYLHPMACIPSCY